MRYILLNNILDTFINNRMKILLIVKEHQIKIEDRCFCPLNQQEIAELVPCSKLKANQILNELINEGYIKMIRRKGRYVLSKKGEELVNKFYDINFLK